MTKRELLALLARYDDDTPIITSRGFDFQAHHISERIFDDWSEAERTPEGWEVPAVTDARQIGPQLLKRRTTVGAMRST
jgi:hypothetical protein